MPINAKLSENIKFLIYFRIWVSRLTTDSLQVCCCGFSSKRGREHERERQSCFKALAIILKRKRFAQMPCTKIDFSIKMLTDYICVARPKPHPYDVYSVDCVMRDPYFYDQISTFKHFMSGNMVR